jgi:class 3 adenylate cyclase
MTELSDLFQDLLLRYSQEPDAARRETLESRLWQEFGAERAVLVLDMSGFSQLAIRFGIVHYLSMVRRMQLTAEPIVRRYSGTLVKFEADNCFAMFADVADAIQAAIELNDAFSSANDATPDELDIRIACGIDFGSILVVPGVDFFGNAVNRASKLGEDLAEAGEILVTREAMATLPAGHAIDHSPRQYDTSGIHIETCVLTRK